MYLSAHVVDVGGLMRGRQERELGWVCGRTRPDRCSDSNGSVGSSERFLATVAQLGADALLSPFGEQDGQVGGINVAVRCVPLIETISLAGHASDGHRMKPVAPQWPTL